jgi:hypothetical protein
MANRRSLVTLVALVPVVLWACTASPPPGGPWKSEIALEAGKKLGGCAVGDLDPRHPGNEIVAVAGDGSVYLAWRDGNAWKNEVIYRAGGEMIQCAIGDVNPERPGNELIVVGMEKGGEEEGGAGAAHVVYRDEDGWKGELVFRDKALIHGVCAAEGGAVMVGFSRMAHRLTRNAGAWKVEPMGPLPADGKAALAFGDAVVVACNNGWLGGFEPTDHGWKTVDMDKRPAGRSRLGSDGKRAIVADDDGTLSIAGPDGSTEIYRDSAKLRGAVLADLDPSRPGLEAATAGYSMKVTLLHRDGEKWVPRTLYEDTAGFHHLAAGDVDGRPGLELVACGYSGKLVVLTRTGS